MVALPVIDGVHRVAISWRVGAGGPTAANVLHFHGNSVDPDALRTLLNASVTAAMWTGVVSTAIGYQLAITPLDVNSATRIYTPDPTKFIGGGGSGEYSPSTAAVVSLRTAKRGRRYRGRIYLPFIVESAMNSGTFTSVPSGGQTAWDNFRNAMKTGGWPLHVASYGHSLHRTRAPGGGYVSTVVTWTPGSEEVVNTTFESAFGTQRRRQSRLR